MGGFWVTEPVDCNPSCGAEPREAGALPDADVGFPCIVGVPQVSSAVPAAPLDVTPAVLWTRTVGQKSESFFPTPPRELALAGDRLAVSTSQAFHLLDLEGNEIASPTTVSAFPPSDPSADADGNFYFVHGEVVSIASDGTLRWSVPPYPGMQSPKGLQVESVAVSPDGVLYFAGSDGMLRGFQTSDGDRVLETFVGTDPNTQPLSVSGGMGDTLVLDGWLYSRVANAVSGTYPVVGGQALWVESLSPQGVSARAWEGGSIRGHVLDLCGVLQWSLPAGWTAPLVGLGGAFVAWGSEQPFGLALYSASGMVLAGPVVTDGIPIAVGGDGVVYTMSYSSMYEGVLAAWSADLQAQWTLSLGELIESSAPVISDDGVMYLLVQRPDHSLDVVAVQTSSPGLAPTARPTARYGSRGSGWVE